MEETSVISDGTRVIIHIWTKFIETLFNNFTFDNGVSVGWVIIAVSLIGIMISTILSRPISNETSWERKSKEE